MVNNSQTACFKLISLPMAGITLVLALLLAGPLSANAQINPCVNHERTVQRAEQNAQRMYNEVINLQDRLAQQIESQQNQLFGLQNQLANAEANLATARGQNNASFFGCGINLLFNAQRGCFANAAQAAIFRIRAAESQVNQARSRINYFVTFANNQNQRQAERIRFSQDRYNTSITQYQQASAAYNACLANSYKVY